MQLLSATTAPKWTWSFWEKHDQTSQLTAQGQTTKAEISNSGILLGKKTPNAMLSNTHFLLLPTDGVKFAHSTAVHRLRFTAGFPNGLADNLCKMNRWEGVLRLFAEVDSNEN